MDFYNFTAGKSAGQHTLSLLPQPRDTQPEDISDLEEVRWRDAGKQIALAAISR